MYLFKKSRDKHVLRNYDHYFKFVMGNPTKFIFQTTDFIVFIVLILRSPIKPNLGILEELQYRALDASMILYTQMVH